MKIKSLNVAMQLVLGHVFVCMLFIAFCCVDACCCEFLTLICMYLCVNFSHFTRIWNKWSCIDVS